jgi:hypothetical protein
LKPEAAWFQDLSIEVESAYLNDLALLVYQPFASIRKIVHAVIRILLGGEVTMRANRILAVRYKLISAIWRYKLDRLLRGSCLLQETRTGFHTKNSNEFLKIIQKHEHAELTAHN